MSTHEKYCVPPPPANHFAIDLWNPPNISISLIYICSGCLQNERIVEKWISFWVEQICECSPVNPEILLGEQSYFLGIWNDVLWMLTLFVIILFLAMYFCEIKSLKKYFGMFFCGFCWADMQNGNFNNLRNCHLCWKLWKYLKATALACTIPVDESTFL